MINSNKVRKKSVRYLINKTLKLLGLKTAKELMRAIKINIRLLISCLFTPLQVALKMKIIKFIITKLFQVPKFQNLCIQTKKIINFTMMI